MRRHDAPAFGHAYPRLALPTVVSRARELDVRRGRIAPVTRDHGFAHHACHAFGIARAAIRRDFRVAIQVLADAVAQGLRVVPEHFVQHRDIVVDDRLLIAVKLAGDFGQGLRVIDFHRRLSLNFQSNHSAADRRSPQ